MAKNLDMILLVQQTSAVVFSRHHPRRAPVDAAGRDRGRGRNGATGQPGTVPFTANIWLNQK